MDIDPRYGIRLARPLWLAACALALAMISVRSAEASGIPVCVSTNAELRNALATAAFLPTTFEIVQGTYDLAGSVWSHDGADDALIQAGSEILGGYTPGCAGRNIEVGNTVLFDSDPGDLPIDGTGVLGDLTIEGMTVTAPGGLTLSANGLRGYPALPAGTMILLRRDAFINAENGGLWISWNEDEDVGGTIRIVDTLIAANYAVNRVGEGCSLLIEDDMGAPKIQLVHNTIVDNAGSGNDGTGACVLNDFLGDASGTLVAYNNIFYGNDTRDLTTDAGVVLAQLVDNVIGPHHTPGAFEVGTESGNPRLDGSYAPIESPPSPVINTGSLTAPGGLPTRDLPGHDRMIGSAPDRGAFESGINDSFLQTVTSTGDSGAGSLRSAILSANAHGSGLIDFNLGSGCGPHVITLSSPLPSVAVPLIVNGYSQAGAAANDLDIGTDARFCVILEAGNSSVTKALQIPASASDSVSLIVEGLAFSGFSEAAIALGAGSGSIVTGNRFGGTVGSHALNANGAGIRLDAATHDNTIGGDDPAAYNIIGGSSDGSGIDLFGSLTSGTHDNQILNNLIGVDWSGDANGSFSALANGARGIYLAGHGNEISGNWIGDNAQAGIFVANGGATDNTIENNFVGFLFAGTTHGNGAAGIHLGGDVGDAPAANVIRYNTIAQNQDEGVWVEIGQQNRIRRNTIHGNDGLGIDLADPGVLANDNDGAAGPPDYANRGLNYPTLATALGGRSSGEFTALLESSLGEYRVDFYETPAGCDPNDNRQGEFWIGSVAVSITKAAIGGDGAASIDAVLGSGVPGGIATGAGITATATDSAGNTSEFSACIPYQDDTIFANGFDPLT